MKNNKQIQNLISQIREKIESLEKLVKKDKFKDSENHEEAQNELESLFIGLDDLEDIFDRDYEVGLMNQTAGG